MTLIKYPAKVQLPLFSEQCSRRHLDAEGPNFSSSQVSHRKEFLLCNRSALHESKRYRFTWELLFAELQPTIAVCQRPCLAGCRVSQHSGKAVRGRLGHTQPIKTVLVQQGTASQTLQATLVLHPGWVCGRLKFKYARQIVDMLCSCCSCQSALQKSPSSRQALADKLSER